MDDHSARQLLMLSAAWRYSSGAMRQQRLRMSALRLWEALVPPSHHTLARWHISKSSNLLQINFSSSYSPSNCTSLTLSRYGPNRLAYSVGERCFSQMRSFLKTSWELVATKAGKLERRQLRRTEVVGSLRMLVISSGKSFFSMDLRTIERIFLPTPLLPEMIDSTEQTFSQSSSPSYSYSSSSSSSSSSSARTTLPMVLLATSASASSELVVLVICAYLSRIVLRE